MNCSTAAARHLASRYVRTIHFRSTWLRRWNMFGIFQLVTYLLATSLSNESPIILSNRQNHLLGMMQSANCNFLLISVRACSLCKKVCARTLSENNGF